mmetsp:Transcript_12096/g.34597  ORF Transcript_12096/g.34597 Transcript_12096/m.34597 type:complete len:236 (-) Transcript_12096:33-740(-)
MLELGLRRGPVEAVKVLSLASLILLLEDLTDQTPHGTGDVIDVLRLDGGLHGVLQDLGEVILKVGSAEVDEDLLPVGGGVVLAEVGLHLAGEDLEGGTFADAVGTDEAENLARTGHGEPMELEGVGTVSVGGVALQILGKVDDGNGLEGALLDADTASDAKRLGEEGKLALGTDLNAKLAHFDDGTGLLAFLSALLGLALVRLDDGDTGQLIGIVPGLVLASLLLGRHFGKCGLR